MSKITEYIIVIGVIVAIALGVFNLNCNKPELQQGISPEAQHKIDSMNNIIYNAEKDKAVLQERNNNLAFEIFQLQLELAQIKPNTVKKWNDYSIKTRTEKERIAYENRDRMKKEMEGEK